MKETKRNGAGGEKIFYQSRVPYRSGIGSMLYPCWRWLYLLGNSLLKGLQLGQSLFYNSMLVCWSCDGMRFAANWKSIKLPLAGSFLLLQHIKVQFPFQLPAIFTFCESSGFFVLINRRNVPWNMVMRMRSFL